MYRLSLLNTETLADAYNFNGLNFSLLPEVSYFPSELNSNYLILEAPQPGPLFANVDGTPGDDSLTGTNSDDTINGFAGSDTIIGLAGNDTINGGDDDDLSLIHI